MSLYTRARKHIDMDRVKELREEKIKREQIAKLVQEQERIRAELEYIEAEESKYINWRKELEEGMTTSGFMTNNLPAEGDTVLDTATWVNNGGTDTENGSGFGGAELTLSGTPSGVVYNGGEIGFSINLRDFDTLLVDVTTDGARVLIFGSLANGTPEYLDTTSSGTYSIDISNESDTRTWTIFATAGTVTISNPRVQRKSPLSVFVGLDEPAASAFIRDGDFDRLSNEQKKKKLVQQLKSSEEYLNKMFGGGMPKGATQIADFQPQRSFIDIRTTDTGRTTARGTTDTGRTTARGTTIPTPRQSSDDSQQSTGNPYADKYGLPADYQDKIMKAYAYFQNNNYTLAGRTDMNASKDLMTKAFKMQGFTDKQIKSIRDNKLLQTRQVNLSQIERLKQKREQEAREKQAAERKQRQRELRRRQREARRQRQLNQRRNRSNARTNRQQSYMDIKVGSNTGKDYGEIASAQQGPIPPGPRGYKKPGTYDPNKFYNLAPGSLPSPNIPPTGPGYSQKQGDTQVAGNFPKADPSKAPPPIYNPMNPGMPTAPGGRPFEGPPGTPGGKYPMAKLKNKKKSKKTTMVAQHEPQGETIMEKNKKSFKDLTKKIPGYYDGKPAPLGFPIEEPPKMKNGYHPDLVDGKKVANRFNRLDPQSAKAMPKTGNPHIDKKVRAAAKKPK